ncbi:MAG: hypothetical protein J7L63_04260 [Thermoplasmata archaeon]|nr:hypothetical protein [Thermoplasmata archaeon]
MNTSSGGRREYRRNIIGIPKMQGIEGGMGVAGAKKKRMKNEVVINNPQRNGYFLT